jgi:addiction module RelE/StbE family toxin
LAKVNLSQTSQFKRDIKRQRQRGKDLEKLREVVDLIVSGNDLPPNLRDHPLTGARLSRRAGLAPDLQAPSRGDHSRPDRLAR